MFSGGQCYLLEPQSWRAASGAVLAAVSAAMVAWIRLDDVTGLEPQSWPS